jgi:hypothetical protein
MDNERSVDYLELLRNLPSDLSVASTDDIFACVQPLLSALMEHVMLWFGHEDGMLVSLHRLRFVTGMMILEPGYLSAKLRPKRDQTRGADSAVQNELRIHAPVPDAAWKGITALELTALYGVRKRQFGPLHEAIFNREARHLWLKLIDKMRPMLARDASVTVRIKKTTMRELASTLNFDSATASWAVGIQAEYDPNDSKIASLLQAWAPLFYAALRFAMPATDNEVDDILDGDPKNALVLQRLPPEAHPVITDERVASTGNERPGDYRELLRNLPSDLNEASNDAIFRCVQPLLGALMVNAMLWFGREDETLILLSALDYADGMIILELGSTFAILGPDEVLGTPEEESFIYDSVGDVKKYKQIATAALRAGYGDATFIHET